MAEIVMYSGPTCPYCERAKELLRKKGVTFTDYNVKTDLAKYDEMLMRTEGRRTIPQIFIDGMLVGGCADLYRLDEQGLLDSMLGV